MTRPVLGWDVGGANVKVAWVGENLAAIPRVLEVPFALWREPQRLPEVLAQAAERLSLAQTMAVTMTAELADCFSTKREGVEFVLDAFRSAFPRFDPQVYGVDGEFRSLQAAKSAPDEVAAANWRASATLVARTFPDALLVDVGSTTTDLIPIVSGHVAAVGYSDTARLSSGELVYTGALRTPVSAIVRSLPLGGARCRIAAEHFAVAADVYRWLDRIDEAAYSCETPDGRGRGRLEAGARLARMVCADFETLGADGVTAIAEEIAQRQTRQIACGIRQIIRRLGPEAPAVAVLAGQGAFLAQRAVAACGLEPRDLAGEFGDEAARSTPAVAVAILLADKT
jgi:(4-(4-[2-(gamma-L-glutamylamino)ethyl]phenoxymethyl)furan-2-yl)methanamine synthase